MSTNVRGYALGTLAILALSAVSIADLAIINDDNYCWWIMYAAFPVGGLVTAYIAISHRSILAAALSVPATAIALLWFWAYTAIVLPSFLGGGGAAGISNVGIDPSGFLEILL